jgi:Ca2+-dependent lipid-binding protein
MKSSQSDGCIHQSTFDSSRWTVLQSPNKKSTKGELRYTAEFYPTVALAEPTDDDDDDNQDGKDNMETRRGSNTPETEPTLDNNQIAPSPTPTISHSPASPLSTPTDLMDLHGYPIKRTPDGLLDLCAYNTGVLKIRIHEVNLSKQVHAYCAVMVDSLYSQFKTSAINGRTLVFNEASDAFIKEADFSRLAIEVKPVDSDEKSDEKYGYWTTSASDIIRRIQHQERHKSTITTEGPQEGDDEDGDGEWFDLLDAQGGPGKIRLSFGYTPLMNFELNPDESLESKWYKGTSGY